MFGVLLTGPIADAAGHYSEEERADDVAESSDDEKDAAREVVEGRAADAADQEAADYLWDVPHGRDDGRLVHYKLNIKAAVKKEDTEGTVHQE